MNTGQLKSYAPEARRIFIAAVSAQAARLGISDKGVAGAEVQGDVLLVGGQAFSKVIASGREELVKNVEAIGFEAAVDAIAYTWFNRFVAIRYMELHGYLDHGYRVLSHPAGQGRPEILDHAADVDLPGLDRERAIELKLNGAQDEELYRLLLLAQCNALHQAMPFLFEPIGGAGELLLPANLLHSDSLIRQLVESIDEELWQDIEIIGWLYQFYISEKKDEVIGKVVKSEDIPAATQLFTPNWIVKYMVQNSLGAQWLATYPQSPLKGQMDYYIEPAEQTDEVKKQLADITPDKLDPEALTLIDPACGSGHILVEAYELFKAIYLERGYRQRDVPQLILEKNLFGLDIDRRAAQLTGFALMMKGRSDDRRMFERRVKLNVMALVDSAGFNAEELAEGINLADYGLSLRNLTDLKDLFEHATTFGSLIQVPVTTAKKLPALKHLSAANREDLFVSATLKQLEPLVQQAMLLAAQYNVSAANPPYMGSSGMNMLVKKFVKDCFPEAKENLFACFINRCCTLACDGGSVAMITMHNWMFLSSFEKLRERLLRTKTIEVMGHLGARAFSSISGEVVQATSFVLKNQTPHQYKPVFNRLLDGDEEAKRLRLIDNGGRFDSVSQMDLLQVPGSLIAYWASPTIVSSFARSPLGSKFTTREGMATADNDRFLRRWSEVCVTRIRFDCSTEDEAEASGGTWFPYDKGGSYRRWHGNNELVVEYANCGANIKDNKDPKTGRIRSHNYNSEFGFREGLTWSAISSGLFSVRYSKRGSLFDSKGAKGFCGDWLEVIALLNSCVAQEYLSFLSPTLDIKVGDVIRIPLASDGLISAAVSGATAAVNSARCDWNAYERSWDFQTLPLLTASSEPTPTLESSYSAWTRVNKDTIAWMKRLEEENNQLFIDAYGLGNELTPEVPIEQIALTVNPAYRYGGKGGKLTFEAQGARFREDTCEELVSYAIGCMMGRYSLDAPGLIYAHSGNDGFDPNQYTTFPADDDGIIPLTDTEWFDDDGGNRLIRFLSTAWDATHLENNLTFLADNLNPRKNESSRETLRRYLCDSFFKGHLKTYKKRPIYWLFSSGKQKACQCLVYLHRYNEGTLSRMRSEYVIPLQGKMAARLDKLQGDIQVATSTAHQKRLEKERGKLEKQQVELIAFDEKLRHFADRRISLDLDDGVKVNYGKFGDMLGEVKAVHGKKPEMA